MGAVPVHRHCRVCGAVTPPEDPFCSPACAQKRAAQVRTQRMYTLLFLAMAVFLLVLLVRSS